MIRRDVAEPSIPPPRDLGPLRLSEYNFSIGHAELVTTLRDIKEARFLRETHSNPDRKIRTYGVIFTILMGT